ncbi:MAG: response regulator [Candidatus Bathyarchaeota archaeon]|nr:response regulator [Candidatus Bathyarchaeota archaeon]
MTPTTKQVQSAERQTQIQHKLATSLPQTKYQLKKHDYSNLVLPRITLKGVEYEALPEPRLLDSILNKGDWTTTNLGTVTLTESPSIHPVIVSLQCTSCNSTQIMRKNTFIHPLCGYVGDLDDAVDGSLLRCPKCAHVLEEHVNPGERVSNHGYCILGNTYHCRECNEELEHVNLTVHGAPSRDFTKVTQVTVKPIQRESWVDERKEFRRQAEEITEQARVFTPPTPRPPMDEPSATDSSGSIQSHIDLLLVEEDAFTKDFIAESLEEHQSTFTVMHASSGKIALKSLRSKHDFIVLDSELSDMDSVLILKEINRWRIKTPVIMLCDESMSLDEDYIQKHGNIMIYKKTPETIRKLPVLINQLISKLAVQK